MKTPIINIFASSNRNLVHYIYRSETPIEKELEEFITNRTPVGMIDEATARCYSKEMKEITMLKEEYPKGQEGYIQLSLPFNFNCSNSKYEINFRNNANSQNDFTIQIEIGSNVLISASKQQAYSGMKESIINDVKLRNNAILISNDISTDYDVITFTGTINVYKFYDIGRKFENITPVRGHGIYKPVIKTIETTNQIIFYQDKEKQKNTYYYYVISRNNNGHISEISNTQIIEIAEDNIDFSLYESNNYYDNDAPTFSLVQGINATSKDDIKIDKKDIHSNIIITDNINLFPKDLDTENKRIIYVTNVWTKENRKLLNRNRKAYKAVNTVDDIKAESDIFTFKESQEEVMIDKIEIFKKDVTFLSPEEAKSAITLNDKDASLLKVLVRQGGVYYNSYFLGKDMETNDYDFPEYMVSAITLDSTFPLIKVNDTCIKGNKYNYTMYLYDKDKNISEPIVKVV